MIQNKITIGITGSIGTGKSSVSKYLESKGYIVIDADKISKDIYYIGSEAYIALVNAFGKEIIDDDNKIDRKKLKEIVFYDKKKLETLNKIVHPIIVREIENQKKYYLATNRIVFLDAALLIESGLNKNVDKIILVTCNDDTQIERIISRDNISIDIAKKIIKSQMPTREKMVYADYIIKNDVSLDSLYNKIDEILIQIEKGNI